jgi:hypothetical protein
VRDGKLKQIGQWYQAERWLSNQAPATFILDDGAGRLRQFGRMAVYKDILGQEAGSLIWTALRNAIQGVRAATSEQRRLEIVVVGSFAGGTGSGMFIDIALILRMLAQQLGVHHVLRGFFALPSVFTTAPGKQMKARSFAAWRELNRFMVVNPDFPMPMITYVEDNPTFRIQPDQRLFDACYLVDGKSGGQPIAEEAKYGVFPMLAETVSAILDKEAGAAYTEWIFTNLAPEYARRPELPMYSTVGAYTVQVPAHFVQEVSSHIFAQKALLKLLSPKTSPDEDGKLVFGGAERHLALAAPDKNQEDPGYAGRMRSRRLLRESSTFDGKTAKPTLFHGRIAQIVEQCTDMNRHATIIDQLARAGGADPKLAAAAVGWVSYFPNLGDDPEFEAVRRVVNEHMSYSVVQQYRRRDPQKEEEVRNNFKKIPDDLRTRFGGISSTGEEIEDYHGKCGEALQQCLDVQLIIFRQLVRLQLSSLLNGQSEDAVKAKSGKLGYAWDYFDGMVSEMDEFLKIMSEVKRRRDEIKPELQIAGLAERSKRFLDATVGKKIFWIVEHPHVKGAEQAYLQAQQRIMELRREDILHSYVLNTALRMKSICQEICATLQRWIWHLATGDDAAHLTGMWDGVRTSLEQVQNAHSYDSTIPKVQRLVADQTLPFSDEDIEQALQQWNWVVEFIGKPPQFNIGAQITSGAVTEQPVDLSDPGDAETPQMRLEIGKRNQAALMGLVRRRFTGVAARTTVAEEIKRQFPDPKTFATQVANISAEPLIDKDPEASPRKKSNLIRVQTNPKDPYFIGITGVEGYLRQAHNLDLTIRDDTYGIQVVGSENPYKLTLVRTDDLYSFEHFAAWGSCLEAYAGHMEVMGQPMDPVLMQNFAAEARSVEYERELMKTGNRSYRPLHPRVVMFLEDPLALRQFAYLGMLGMIGEKTTNKVYRWELIWEMNGEEQTIWLTRGWNKDLDAAMRPQPTIFNAIHGYNIVRRTQDPSRTLRIDHDEAQRLIDSEMARVGAQGEIKLLQANLKGGFVGGLRALAYKRPETQEGVLREDFADLASVVELMLKERINELQKAEKTPKARGARGGAKSSFFVTADEVKPTRSRTTAKKPVARTSTRKTSTSSSKPATGKPPASGAKPKKTSSTKNNTK